MVCILFLQCFFGQCHTPHLVLNTLIKRIIIIGSMACKLIVINFSSYIKVFFLNLPSLCVPTKRYHFDSDTVFNLFYVYYIDHVMYRDGEHIGQLYAEKDNLICERVGHFDNVLFNSLTSLMVSFAILFYLNCRHIATLGWPGYKCTRRLTHRLA